MTTFNTINNPAAVARRVRSLASMSWSMVTDAEIRQLAVPEKMFAYASSYLRGATALCDALANAPTFTWADGAVVLMMSAHSTELFLKGMLLKRVPEQLVRNRGHDIESLAADYQYHFPEAIFDWEVPFKTEYPERMTPEDVAELATRRDALPSILFRYPVGKDGNDWKGSYAFEPNSFLPVLRNLSDAFSRVSVLEVKPMTSRG